ncbi:hypothetical protein LIER_19447 [Lithospermum erythrorhizon]|uniref:Transposase (putative) gypsy type domain-containing protein n=1 Tax=Lithospermum erythrorhizon TaxID=34254 RepID=A0AAV3QNE6_LITER
MHVPTSRDTTLFWKFLNYGLRLPVSGFVDDVLMTLDCAPGQLMPFAWLVLTVFQVACLSVGVLPNMAFFSVMYNIIHKGPWPISNDEVRAHWSLSNSTLFVEDSAKTQAEVEKLRAGFPQALPHEVFCDQDVLIKARLTKGVDKFPDTTLLELLSLKHSSGGCVMPHKVNFKAVTMGKDALARISKQKSVDISESSSDAPSLAPVPKKS